MAGKDDPKLDTTHWSGEGTFTQLLIDHLRALETIALVRVEDAPATRSDADYNFISNEVFVAFATRDRQERIKRFGFIPASRTVLEKSMTMEGLEQALTAAEQIGGPDYADGGMLQFLRTERVVPPYQTRGYKIVELVRIYEAKSEAQGSGPRGQG
jgi:hypothetical protein